MDRTRRGAVTGHGLIGMRERAKTAGGRLTAGFHQDGTNVVEATVPLAGEHATLS